MALNFSYTLSEQEVYTGLRLSGAYKSTGRRGLVETIVLVVFCIFFLIAYIRERDTFSLVMALVSAAVAVVLNLVPRLDMRKQAKKGRRDIKLRLYPDKLFVDTQDGSQKLLLDGSSTIRAVGRKQQRMVVVLMEKGGLLLIPERAIPKEIRGRALSILLQHDRDE